MSQKEFVKDLILNQVRGKESSLQDHKSNNLELKIPRGNLITKMGSKLVNVTLQILLTKMIQLCQVVQLKT